MIAASEDFSAFRPSDIFDMEVNLAQWDPASQSYSLSRSPAFAVKPGCGYWSRMPPGGVDLYDMGVPVDSTKSYEVTLDQGWNMIGNPFGDPLAIQSLHTLTARGTAYSIGTIGSVVSPIFFTWPAGANEYSSISSCFILPYTGYWIFAYAPCTLTFPGTAK